MKDVLDLYPQLSYAGVNVADEEHRIKLSRLRNR